MKLKNFDVVFSQRTESLIPIYQLIHIDRVTDEKGVSLDFDSFSKIIKKFLESSEFNIKMNALTPSLQVIDAINKIKTNDKPIKADFEDFFSTLNLYNFDCMVVGRIDQNEVPTEITSDYYYRSYLLENFTDNSVGVSRFYLGYSYIYTQDSFPYSYDYISLFGLSSSQMQEHGLDISSDSYSLLKSQGNLKYFDDNTSYQYILSRDYSYKVLVNSSLT